ncbi:hypothetical protein DY000_02059867 [Brassica cretica]|uniref:Uncharacterized protein n=1 Tax=Brassica cretica TaxID=69181 RepID=A0ABQ7ASB6_BRACR|nr:hypothetical protein DY000_02059867 [Brassica cretica]
MPPDLMWFNAIRTSDVLTNFDALTAPVSPIPEELFSDVSDSDSFESQAVTFHNKLEGFGGDPRVFVTSRINPRIVGATMYYFLARPYALKCHVRDSCRGGFFNELASRHSWNKPASSLLRGYTKVEPLSISELTKFILTAKPQVVQHSDLF